MSKKFDVKEKLNNPAKEAYRVLKTNIQFCSIDKEIRTVAIVSTDHMDGKTTTTINLAMSMTNSGMKVLLIDADLRKPLKYKHFGDQNILGLADIIAGYTDFSDAVSKTNIEDFFILTAGTIPPYPTEFLSSHIFDEILERAKKEYDFIIIDTPAMGSYIDGAVIASKADGAILLAKWKSTYYRSILMVKNQLEKANATILGVILNKVSKSEYSDYYIMNYSYDHLKHSYDYKNTGIKITTNKVTTSDVSTTKTDNSKSTDIENENINQLEKEKSNQLFNPHGQTISKNTGSNDNSECKIMEENLKTLKEKLKEDNI